MTQKQKSDIYITCLRGSLLGVMSVKLEFVWGQEKKTSAPVAEIPYCVKINTTKIREANMLEIYKGIKIEDEVIIVEKQNDLHQGYLVSKNSKEQLETALRWAECEVHKLDKDGNPIVKFWKWQNEKKVYFEDSTGCYHEYEWETKSGIVHEYKNGKFKLSLSMSALGSSQGGKLSFWNCTITAPDEKKFLIGINSDCLLSLLSSTTFVNGQCQADLWLGRIKNNVGAFTETMDEFIQGKKDQAIRDIKKTSKYEAGAILLPSHEVYCGKFNKWFDIYKRRNYARTTDYIINIFSTPKPAYLYLGTRGKTVSEMSDELTKSGLGWWDFKNSKRAGRVSDESLFVDTEQLFKNTFLKEETYAKNNSTAPYSREHLSAFSIQSLIQYQKSNDPKYPTEAEILYKQFSKDAADGPQCSVNELKAFFEQYKIPYVVDSDKEDLEEIGFFM